MGVERQPPQALRAGEVRLWRWALGGALVLIGYLAVIPLALPQVTGMDDKIGHLLAFAALALLADFAFPRSPYGAAKVLPLLGYGALIEAVQYLLPYRTFSLLDLLADGAGLLAYGAAVPLLRRVPGLRRRWGARTAGAPR